jgi:DNA gyrase/topoisomerase IV subunit A
VVALAVVVPDATLLVAGENGIGKRTDFDEYRLQSRAGKGIITMKTTEKTGNVVGALTVKDATKSCSSPSPARWCARACEDIREAGRNTQGVKLIELGSPRPTNSKPSPPSSARKRRTPGGNGLPRQLLSGQSNQPMSKN